MNRTWEGRKKIVPLTSLRMQISICWEKNILKKCYDQVCLFSLSLLRQTKYQHFLFSNYSIIILVTLPWTLQNSTCILSSILRHQTGHTVLLFQPACDTLTALILLFSCQWTEFVPCCGVATGLTLSWVPGRLPAALLSTVFSHRFLCWSINTCPLYFDVWLHIFACIQFTKKSACSVPVSCPLWEFPLPKSLLPATDTSDFLWFWKSMQILYNTWPKHSSHGTKTETHLVFPICISLLRPVN